jgi:hypothetical protein
MLLTLVASWKGAELSTRMFTMGNNTHSMLICRTEQKDRRLSCSVNNIGIGYVDRPSKGFAAEHAQRPAVVPLHRITLKSCLSRA